MDNLFSVRMGPDGQLLSWSSFPNWNIVDRTYPGLTEVIRKALVDSLGAKTENSMAWRFTTGSRVKKRDDQASSKGDAELATPLQESRD